MTDESIMPFGKYKGEKIANVPAKYLMWLYYEGKVFGEVKQYISDNKDVLEQEILHEK
jgi:uncharacterized protein (DUF3820 family)